MTLAELAALAVKMLPYVMSTLNWIKQIRAATIDTNPEIWAGVRHDWIEASDEWDAKMHPKP